MTTMNNEGPADPSVHAQRVTDLPTVPHYIVELICDYGDARENKDSSRGRRMSNAVGELHKWCSAAVVAERERAARVSQATAQRVPARSETGPFAYTGAQLLASQPANDELPETVARIAILTNHQGGKWYALEPLVSNPLTINTKVYTAEQMREAIAAERALLLTDIAALREALDEAATDCELHPLYLGDSATLDDIIRTGGDAAFVTGLARGLREARGSAAEKEQPK